MGIAENYQRVRREIPDCVTIIVAGKTRTKEEMLQVIAAGATDIGENYVQEAQQVCKELGNDAKRLRWHMIGHLQTNKISKALQVFDVVQTVDSLEKAVAVNSIAESIGKIIPVYIEVNIGGEVAKSGVSLEYVESLAKDMSKLCYLSLDGLMAMGPIVGDSEELRPYFRKMKELFEKIKALDLPGVNMRVLSMGMSDSYRIAIEEGSNMVRLGTVIFGERS